MKSGFYSLLLNCILHRKKADMQATFYNATSHDIISYGNKTGKKSRGLQCVERKPEVYNVLHKILSHWQTERWQKKNQQ